MEFREATTTDLSNIASLHATSWQENYHPVLSQDYLKNKVHDERVSVCEQRLLNPSEKQFVLVAEHQGKFCGFVCVYGEQHPLFGTIIDNLHVATGFKGLGVGTQLLKRAAQWASISYPDQDLYLEVLECNSKAIGFYQSLGASSVETKYWHTPCGNKAKEFVYSWGAPSNLLDNVN